MGSNGNGNGGSIFHFWQDLELAEGDAPIKPIEEYHLDCRGTKRRFRLTNYPRGPESFLEARELRDGEPWGFRLRVSYDEEKELPPYFALRRKLAERLATRDLVRDPDSRRLEVLNMRLRAQVGGRPDGSSGPVLFIDDQEVTWEQLGELLQTYEGWGLQIQITDE